ncbi:hypothetical protein LTR10_014989 [Elasticomyces elasticus]|nr:hypothetical protein LTR10_014989 [Elasticomyces elasticus]KAK4964567.1 hypothetical protein LTR42_012863 [Elasticomyces elasticus]
MTGTGCGTALTVSVRLCVRLVTSGYPPNGCPASHQYPHPQRSMGPPPTPFPVLQFGQPGIPHHRQQQMVYHGAPMQQQQPMHEVVPKKKGRGKAKKAKASASPIHEESITVAQMPSYSEEDSALIDEGNYIPTPKKQDVSQSRKPKAAAQQGRAPSAAKAKSATAAGSGMMGGMFDGANDAIEDDLQLAPIISYDGAHDLIEFEGQSPGGWESSEAYRAGWVAGRISSSTCPVRAQPVGDQEMLRYMIADILRSDIVNTQHHHTHSYSNSPRRYDCLVEKFRNFVIMSEYKDYRPSSSTPS